MTGEGADLAEACVTANDLFRPVLELAGPARDVPDALQIGEGERIVAIGDSITQGGGYLRAMDAVFRQQYPELGIPIIVNVGISGQKAEDMAARFERDVVNHRPDVATLSVGINDVWHRMEMPHDDRVLARYRDNLDRMVTRALETGIRMYLLAPTVIEEDPKSEGNRRLAGYVAAGMDVARQRGCGYIDLHALFLAAVRNRQGEHTTSDPLARHFTRDGVHMLPAGDVLMAIGVLRAWGVTDDKMVATDLGGVFP